MKNSRNLLVALTALVLTTAIFVTGCDEVVGAYIVSGSGKVEARNYDYADFTRIVAGSAFVVNVQRADDYSVGITADDNLFAYLDIRKAGDTLYIKTKGVGRLSNTVQEATITMPDLRSFEISGAAKATVGGFEYAHPVSFTASGASNMVLDSMTVGNADFDVSGASRVSGNMIMGDGEFNMSGASKITLTGRAANITLDGSGASRHDLAGLTAVDARVGLSGGSEATVNVSGHLNVDLSGASRLYYAGTPTIGSVDLSGGSTIHANNTVNTMPRYEGR